MLFKRLKRNHISRWFLTEKRDRRTIQKGCRNRGRQVAVATQLSTVVTAQLQLINTIIIIIIIVIFLVTQYGTLFMSPFRCLELGCGCWKFLEKFVQICLKSFRTAGACFELKYYKCQNMRYQFTAEYKLKESCQKVLKAVQKSDI